MMTRGGPHHNDHKSDDYNNCGKSQPRTEACRNMPYQKPNHKPYHKPYQKPHYPKPNHQHQEKPNHKPYHKPHQHPKPTHQHQEKPYYKPYAKPHLKPHYPKPTHQHQEKPPYKPYQKPKHPKPTHNHQPGAPTPEPTWPTPDAILAYYPTQYPTIQRTPPSVAPTASPTIPVVNPQPSPEPSTRYPSPYPSMQPTPPPVTPPTPAPSTSYPTPSPSMQPTPPPIAPSVFPTLPVVNPIVTQRPSNTITDSPTVSSPEPTQQPTFVPSLNLTLFPSLSPTQTFDPSTQTPSSVTFAPSQSVSVDPTTNTFVTADREAVDCEAIAAGNGPVDAAFDSFDVYMNLIIQHGFSFDSVASSFQSSLQNHVAPKVAACEDRDGRQLQSEMQRVLVPVKIVNVVVYKPVEDQAAQCTVPEGTTNATCFPVSVLFEVFFVLRARERLLQERDDVEFILEEAIEIALLDGSLQVPGLVDVLQIEAIPQTNGVSGISGGTRETRSGDEGLGTGGIVAIAVSALLAILLIFCVVRKKRKTSISVTSSFAKIEDFEYGEDAHWSHEARVVGEEDDDGSSIASVWAGRKEDTTFDNFGSVANSTDVHRCSSATCKLCEARNMNDVTFVSSGTVLTPTPIPRIPRTAKREYMADNSVFL